jgi:geranylgeranyl diphosphate synthase type I
MEFKNEIEERVASINKALGKYVNRSKYLKKYCSYSTKFGKRIRPILLLLTCELLGGARKNAMPAACAVEILHGFTLIHDDIMDKDMLRRGQPTVHAKWGLNIGILTGDYLAILPTILLLELKIAKNRILECVKVLNEANLAICEGQFLDISFEKKKNISVNAYLHMIGNKTAKLIEASTKLGAIIAGASPKIVKKFETIGYKLGLAFQIRDDLLDLLSESKLLGKPQGSDLLRDKKTLPVVHALNFASPKQKKKLDLLSKKYQKGECKLSEIVELFEKIGSMDFAINMEKQLISDVKSLLKKDLKKTPAWETMYNLVTYMGKRKK